ncbi:MAG: cytochrome c oxidase subunit II [Acidimicrobiales bacterium]|nr:cytochrome c oxidase subunit II [Acidimicrobiales bacterium]
MSDPRMRSRRNLSGLVVLLGLLLAGCASDAELDTLKPQSETARQIDDLLDPVLAIAGVVLVLVCGAVAWLGWKNRVASYEGDDDFPEQMAHNNTLEILMTGVPAIIMVVVAVMTLTTHLDINSYDDANAMPVVVEGESTNWEPKIVVVGNQWWWEFRYYFSEDVTAESLGSDMKNLPPADIVTSGQIIIPTGQEVELLVTSRDVIHSFWIPALNGKRDARPGFFAPWKIEADNPGVYFGQCTEFCGLSHARMRMQTIAMTSNDFQAWVDQQMQPAAEATGEAVLRGQEAFVTNCSGCHLVDGLNGSEDISAPVQSGAAPNLTHFASRTTFAGGILSTYNDDGTFNRDDVSRWLREPEVVKDNAANDLPDGTLPRGMPNLGLSERTISDLVAYLETLGPRPTDEIIADSEVE